MPEVIIQNRMDRIFTMHQSPVKTDSGHTMTRKITIGPGQCSPPVDADELRGYIKSQPALSALFDTNRLGLVEKTLDPLSKEETVSTSSNPEPPDNLKNTGDVESEDGKIQHKAKTELHEIPVAAAQEGAAGKAGKAAADAPPAGGRK